MPIRLSVQGGHFTIVRMSAGFRSGGGAEGFVFLRIVSEGGIINGFGRQRGSVYF